MPRRSGTRTRPSSTMTVSDCCDACSVVKVVVKVVVRIVVEIVVKVRSWSFQYGNGARVLRRRGGGGQDRS